MPSERRRQTSLPGWDDPPEEPAGGAAARSSPTRETAPVAAETLTESTASDATSPGDAPPGELTGKTVWVIDANSLIFQVFHAIPEMTSPAGEPVNAVFGFTRDLLGLLETKKPDYLFCALDRPEPTFRHELFPAYKGDRAEMPEELSPQYPKILQIVAALGIPLLDCPTFEADDILATIARLANEAGATCFLVTADKDCRQLITDRVKVFNIRKNQVYDAANLAEDWGVRPDQVVDFQTLVGDSVDGVPGVPLIGPKIASELLNRFGTLEGVYEHLAELPAGKRKQNLAEFRERAALTRRLVRLDEHTPVHVDWAAGRVGRINQSRFLELCQEFGFHSIAQKGKSLSGPATASVWTCDYRTIATTDELHKLVTELGRQRRVSLDTETTHIRPTEADLVGISVAWQAGEGFYIPVRAPAGDPCLGEADVLAALRPVLENAACEKVGQNLKYDLIVLRRAGAEVAGVAFDTMVASYLLDAGERNHNLDELAQRYLDHVNIPITSLIGAGKNQRRMDEAPVATVTQYAAEDADVALRLVDILAPKLADTGLNDLFRDVEMPLIEVLVELESNGIRVDTDRLAELSRDYGQRMEAIEREIYELAGHEFNIASPKQLATVLFTEQGLPVVRKTKTGPSTDADVLEELAAQHPLPAKIIEYRQYSKLKGTYLDAIPTLVSPRTGRVHCSFHQTVAATGRLSSSDPNLQNIPIRTETGREIRSAFLAGPPGWRLLAADYSQIELRVLAHYSGDETLTAAFARDEDVHTLVASQVYGVSQAEVTKDMRRNAKAVNFGVIYGQSPFGLARQLGIEQAAAAEFIDAYFRRYPGVERFIARTLDDCRWQGYVTTILGRRRAIRGIGPGSGRTRNLPERTAINTVIQGSAADLIKLAMIAVLRRLRREGLAARMLLQIHDELVFEAPADELDRLAALVAEAMTGVLTLHVPLKVDVKTGRTWADLEPLN